MSISPCQNSHKRVRSSESPEMVIALCLGKSAKIWELVNAGEKIPGLSGDNSNLRIIIQNCPDPKLIKHVLASMTVEEINFMPPKFGCSVLHAAAEASNAPVVELLLNAKASVNLASCSLGNTALHTVTNFGLANTSKVVISSPGNKQKILQDIFQRAVKTAQVLIQSKAMVNCTNREGRTPLDNCMEEGASYVNIDLIRLLVTAGANLVEAHGLYSQELRTRIEQAVQDGLLIKHCRLEATQALRLQLPESIAALVAEYV